MRRATTILKKEFTDTLRDRRTLITMVVIPLVVIPAMMGLVVKFMQRQTERARAEVSQVAFIGAEYAPELFDRMEADSMVAIVPDVAEEDIDSLIRADSLDGAVVVPEGFLDLVENDRQGAIRIFFQSSNQLNVTQRRMTDHIEAYDDEIVGGRIRRLNLDEGLFDAIAIVPNDISSLQEVLGKTVGGFLPYMFVILCFTGAMYPGIDLGAGEKERGTLETILSSPASRLDIVIGKFLVVATIGFISAVLSMAGLYFGIKTAGEIPAEIEAVIFDILSVDVILMVGSLLVPLAVFFAALILALSLYAKSFKEAQSTLTPLSILVFVPVVLGMLPGVELNAMTALVPVLNVSLATKEVIAGTIDPVLLALCYLSLFVFAGASIAFCVKWFNREAVLFRT